MSAGRVEAVMERLGQRLGITVGQAYTVATGLVVALVLGVVGLPPVFDGVPRPDSAAAEAPVPDGVPDASPSVDPELEDDLAIALAPVLQGGSVDAFPGFSGDGGATGPKAPITTAPSTPPTTAPVGSLRRFASVPDPGAPAGIAVGPDGTVYVTTDNTDTRGGSGASALFAFDAQGRLVDTWRAEAQPPTRSRGLTDVVVDRAGTVWVLDGSTARVLRLDPAADRLVTVATVPDLPACALGLVAAPCESGLSNGAPELRGLGVRPDGGVFVADRVQGVVWSVTPTGSVAVAVAVDDRVAGEGPVDVAALGDGSLVVVLSARLGSTPPGLPAVIRIPMAGGTAGEPVVVADLALEDAPTSVVAAASGWVWVALSGVDEVIHINLEHGDQTRHGEGADPAFDVPTGVALRDGSLLVTNQGAADAGPDRWAVLALAVADRPQS